MATNKTDIYVYAHRSGMPQPELMSVLSAHQARKAFSFENSNLFAR